MTVACAVHCTRTRTESAGTACSAPPRQLIHVRYSLLPLARFEPALRTLPVISAQFLLGILHGKLTTEESHVNGCVTSRIIQKPESLEFLVANHKSTRCATGSTEVVNRRLSKVLLP